MSERAARDQLADVIVQVLDPDALDPVQQEVALAVADAVLGMISEAVLAEREACAGVLDEIAADKAKDAQRFRGGSNPHWERKVLSNFADNAATAIRARPPIP